MVDVKKFWVYVHTTGVKKGWDWVELPDGRRISVPEGKYVKVMNIGNKVAIGFEDLTEEIGEKPDWDFNTPLCVVDEEVDGVQKTAKLRCKFTGRYHVSLFYEGSKVAEFWWGKTFDAPSFSYVDVQALAQQLQIAPAPSVPAMPAFDYVVDIYSDKVVITDSYGNTTTLSTISDLNNWLKNVRGKRIRVNIHDYVNNSNNPLILPQNEYYFHGKGIAYIAITEKNTMIIANNRIDMMYNWSSETSPYFDVSGSTIILRDVGDLEIWSDGFKMTDITVVANGGVALAYIAGDVYIWGNYAYIENSDIRNAVIDVFDTLILRNVTDAGGAGLWRVVSHSFTLIDNVDASHNPYHSVKLRSYRVINVDKGATVAIPLSLPKLVNSEIYVEAIYQYNGVVRDDLTYWSLSPAPPSISYDIDLNNMQIIIRNSDPNNGYSLIVVYVLTTGYFPFRSEAGSM